MTSLLNPFELLARPSKQALGGALLLLGLSAGPFFNAGAAETKVNYDDPNLAYRSSFVSEQSSGATGPALLNLPLEENPPAPALPSETSEAPVAAQQKPDSAQPSPSPIRKPKRRALKK